MKKELASAVLLSQLELIINGTAQNLLMKVADRFNTASENMDTEEFKLFLKNFANNPWILFEDCLKDCKIEHEELIASIPEEKKLALENKAKEIAKMMRQEIDRLGEEIGGLSEDVLPPEIPEDALVPEELDIDDSKVIPFSKKLLN